MPASASTPFRRTGDREPLTHAYESVRRHGHIQVKESPNTWHDELQLVLELFATATVIGYQCRCKVVRLHSRRPVFADKGKNAAVLAQDTMDAYRLQSDLLLVGGSQEGQYDQLDTVPPNNMDELRASPTVYGLGTYLRATWQGNATHTACTQILDGEA